MELGMSSEQWWRTWFHHGHPITVNEPKQIEIHSIYMIIQPKVIGSMFWVKVQRLLIADLL